MRLSKSERRSRRRSVSLTAAGTLAVLVGVMFGPDLAQLAQATQAPTATQLLRSALADAAARGSGHQTVSETSARKRATFSDDVATREGRQNITLTGGAQAHVIVLDGVAYFSGNQTALVNYFGFPATLARTIGNRWVSVPSSSSGYSTIAAAATLPSTLGEVTPTGALSETAPTRIDGQSVVGIRGRAPASLGQPGTETTYVTRSSHPLPVRATISLTASGKAPAGDVTINLTGWGERLALKPPTNTIAASKL